MKYLILSFLILLATNTFSQKQVVIKSAETKEPLAFATAECFEKSWGRYSDSVGIVTIPEEIWNSGKIVCSYVGYETASVTGKPSSEIFLSRLPGRIKDIVVKNCNEFRETNIEVRDKKRNFYFGFLAESNGHMWATFIPNFSRKKGILQTVSFAPNVSDSRAKFDAPIRIRLFELDSETGLPTEEITTEEIRLSIKKEKWLTFDLEKYKLHIPPTGVVVAFEMFDAGPQYHYSIVVNSGNSKKTVERYGWSLLGIKDDNVIGFTKTPGSDWISFKNSFKENKAPQVSLKIRVCQD